MRAIVVYESMFGGTLRIAEAVAAGLTSTFEARVVRASDVGPQDLDGVDLIVVGGPTHAWSMSRPSTRKGAPDYARKPGSGLDLEPGADISPGVREWLESLSHLPAAAAAFDTRIAMPAVFTGRASKAIARGLARSGARLIAPPESFLVDKKSHLLGNETERARVWGAELASAYLRSLAKAG